MAETKKAKKVYTLEEIRFKESNRTMAIVACIPIVGLVLFFTEKDDLFVRYTGAQYTIVSVLLAFSELPVIGWMFSPLVFALVVVGMIKASKGERFDIPVVSEWALKLMEII